MDEKTQGLLDRTFGFGVAVLKFLTTLPSNDAFKVPKNQLAKSSTSIGANYEEAQAAESKQDFIHKVGISLKEVRETHYWLRVLRELATSSSNQKVLDEFIVEASEIKKIFSSIKLSAQKGHRK